MKKAAPKKSKTPRHLRKRGVFEVLFFWESTLPETNGLPLKISLPNRKVVFQPSIFRGELLVSGRVSAKE